MPQHVLAADIIADEAFEASLPESSSSNALDVIPEEAFSAPASAPAVASEPIADDILGDDAFSPPPWSPAPDIEPSIPISAFYQSMARWMDLTSNIERANAPLARAFEIKEQQKASGITITLSDAISRARREQDAGHLDTDEYTSFRRAQSRVHSLAEEARPSGAVSGFLTDFTSLLYDLPAYVWGGKGTLKVAEPLLDKISNQITRRVTGAAVAGGGAFATPSVLRGQDPEEIAKQTTIGAVTGAVGQAARFLPDKGPPVLESISRLALEAGAFLGTQKLLYPETEINVDSISHTFATFAALKLVHRSTNRAMDTTERYKLAVQLAKEGKHLSPELAESILDVTNTRRFGSVIELVEREWTNNPEFKKLLESADSVWADIAKVAEEAMVAREAAEASAAAKAIPEVLTAPPKPVELVGSLHVSKKAMSGTLFGRAIDGSEVTVTLDGSGSHRYVVRVGDRIIGRVGDRASAQSLVDHEQLRIQERMRLELEERENPLELGGRPWISRTEANIRRQFEETIVILQRAKTLAKLDPKELNARLNILKGFGRRADVYNTALQIERHWGHEMPGWRAFMASLFGQIREGKVSGYRAEINQEHFRLSEFVDDARKISGKELKGVADFGLEEMARRHRKEAPRNPEDHMNADQLRIWERFNKDISDMRQLYFDVMKEHIEWRHRPRPGFEPVEQELQKQAELEALGKKVAAWEEAPFFPVMRFGHFYVQKRALDNDPTKNIYEEFSSSKQAEKRARQLDSEFGMKEYAPAKSGDKRLDADKEALDTFRGVPRVVSESVMDAAYIEDTPARLRQIQEALFGQTARERLGPSAGIPREGLVGASNELVRVHVTFVNNMIRHLMGVRYRRQMSDSISMMEAQAKQLEATSRDLADPEKAEIVRGSLRRLNLAILNASRLKEYALNPTEEWAGVRQVGFLGYFYFVPKQAVLNMMQLPVATYPELAAHFGDARAMEYLNRAMTDVLRSKIGPERLKRLSNDDLKLLKVLRRSGIIDESLQVEQAAIGEDAKMIRGGPIEGGFSARVFRRAIEYGIMPFRATEIYNREVSAVAAFRGARDQGATFDQAANFALQTVQRTQFEYDRANRPLFMQGRKSAFFLFQTYVQNLLHLTNPFKRSGYDPAAVRSIGALVALAGLQGVPFARDLIDAVDAAATAFTGRSFNSMHWAGKIIDSVLDDPAQEWLWGDLDSDTLLYGLGDTTFGVPQAISSLAQSLGYDFKIPDTTISQAVGMGDVLPGTRPASRLLFGGAAKIGELLGQATGVDVPGIEAEAGLTGEDIGRNVGQMLSEFVGAAGQPMLDMYRAYTTDDLDLAKGVVKFLPIRGLSNPIEGYRLAGEGGSVLGLRTHPERRGKVVASEGIVLDLDDRSRVAGGTAVGLGFQLKEARKNWEKYRAFQEDAGYWAARNRKLVRQAIEIFVYRDDRKEQNKALAAWGERVRAYMDELPYPELGIKRNPAKAEIKKKMEEVRRLEAGLTRSETKQRLFDYYFRPKEEQKFEIERDVREIPDTSIAPEHLRFEEIR